MNCIYLNLPAESLFFDHVSILKYNFLLFYSLLSLYILSISCGIAGEVTQTEGLEFTIYNGGWGWPSYSEWILNKFLLICFVFEFFIFICDCRKSHCILCESSGGSKRKGRRMEKPQYSAYPTDDPHVRWTFPNQTLIPAWQPMNTGRDETRRRNVPSARTNSSFVAFGEEVNNMKDSKMNFYRIKLNRALTTYNLANLIKRKMFNSLKLYFKFEKSIILITYLHEIAEI